MLTAVHTYMCNLYDFYCLEILMTFAVCFLHTRWQLLPPVNLHSLSLPSLALQSSTGGRHRERAVTPTSSPGVEVVRPQRPPSQREPSLPPRPGQVRQVLASTGEPLRRAEQPEGSECT